MTSRHVSNLQFVRLFAAYLVLVRHSLILFGDQNPIPEITVFPVGIWIFFAISGYLLPSSWGRNPKLGTYARNRFRRLFPALATVVLGSIFILGPISTHLSVIEYFQHPMTWSYLLNLALHPSYFLPGVFETNFYPNAVNGSLWSIPPQVLTYALVPLVFLARTPKLRVPLWTILFLAALWADAIGVFSDTVIWGNNFSQAYAAISLFAMGAFLRESKVPLKLPVAVGLFVALGAGLLLFPEYAHVLLALLLPYVVLTVGLRSWPLLRDCNRLPDISYAVFLLGFPVQQVLVAYNPGLHPLVSIPTCIALTTALALVVERFIERPVAERLKK